MSCRYAELAALKTNALKSAQNYRDAKALSDKSDEHKSKGKGKGKGGAHAMHLTFDRRNFDPRVLCGELIPKYQVADGWTTGSGTV